MALTIRFNEDEEKRLKGLMDYHHQKTASGMIKHMVNNMRYYISNIDKLEKKLEDNERELSTVRHYMTRIVNLKLGMDDVNSSINDYLKKI